jgi:hypothetical protein
MAILRMLNPKGQLNQADYNRLFDPMIGALSGSLGNSGMGASGKTQEQIEFETMPTFALYENPDYYGPGSIETMIANSVRQNTPPLQIKQQILEQLNSDPKYLNASDEVSGDLISLANKLSGEWQDFKVASMNNQASSSKMFADAGLSDPSEQYDPREQYADAFANLDNKFAKESKDFQAKRGYNNPAKMYAQNGGLTGGQYIDNPSGAALSEIPESTPKEYVDTADKTMSEAQKEFVAATEAFDKFKKENPDTIDLEYQSLLDRVNNARKNYSGKAVDMAGFTGASKVNPRLPVVSSPKTVKKNPPTMPKAVGTLEGQTKYQNLVRDTMMKAIAQRNMQTGKTPFMDQITQRAIYLKMAGG